MTHLSRDWADTKYDPADLNQSHNINIVLQRYKQPSASQHLESHHSVIFITIYVVRKTLEMSALDFSIESQEGDIQRER